MTVYRSAYGDALYGQNTFGLSGSTVDATATASIAASSTASAQRVKDGAGTSTPALAGSAAAARTRNVSTTSSPALSGSASGNVVLLGSATASVNSSASVASTDILIDGSATISLQNVVVSIAEEYAAADGYRPGYGQRTYGTQIYGRNDSVEAGTATIAAALSVTTAYERERNASATISA